MLNMLLMIWKNRLITLRVIGVICYSLFIYNLGLNYKQKQWNASEVNRLNNEILIERKNQKTSFEIGSNYEQTKDIINSNFNKYVNSLQSNSTVGETKNNASSESNEETRCSRLSKDSKRRLLMLMKEAEINTRQLIALQLYIESSL